MNDNAIYNGSTLTKSGSTESPQGESSPQAVSETVQNSLHPAVFPSWDLLTHQVAADLSLVIVNALRERGRADIAITGGRIGIKVLRALCDYTQRFPDLFAWNHTYMVRR